MGETANHKCSIHHWAVHGIAGRGILLDYRHYAQTNNKPYDPYKTHAITLSELEACAKYQGLDIRPESQGGDIRVGDFLLVRSGFVERYDELSPDARYAAATRSHGDIEFAGVSREPAMREWLHDCYFAGVMGDSPTFEAWPVLNGDHLHMSLLALWGCPIGEMWDLEKLALKCRELGKWTFFMTSAPANMPGMSFFERSSSRLNQELADANLFFLTRWSRFSCQCYSYTLIMNIGIGGRGTSIDVCCYWPMNFQSLNSILCLNTHPMI